MTKDRPTPQDIVPESGGNLVFGDVLAGLSRVPDAVAHTVYLTSHFGANEVQDNDNSTEYAQNLRQLTAALRHAWRVTHEHGSLFVRFPAFHPHLSMALVLGQVCDGKEPHQISRRVNIAGGQQQALRYDRETIFFVRRSDDSVYHAPTAPHKIEGLRNTGDARGSYRLESLDIPAQSPGGSYEFHGSQPPAGRSWRFSAQRMEQLLAAGDIDIGTNGHPRLKRYLSEIPPKKLSMEWDDIPPRAGLEEPDLLLERIIRMSSDPENVVLVPFCDSGTAVLASARLGRRWIGLTNSEDGAQKCRQRLQMLPSPAQGLVSISPLDDYAHIPAAPIESTDLLGSSAAVLSTKKAVDRLRLLPWHSSLEQSLAEHLMKNGVLAVPQFSVPGVPGMVFDFFLPQPPRGAVELCAGHSLDLQVSRVTRVAKDLRTFLGLAARVYLVVIHKSLVRAELREQLSTSGVHLIEADSPETAATSLAADFLPPLLAGSRISTDSSFLPEPDEFSPEFMAMALTYEGLLTPENREVLHHELEQLRTEWRHQHFTAAALRVGRSIEHVVYSACRSWDVPVGERTLAALSRLDDRFDEMRNALLSYSANPSSGRGKVIQKAQAISNDVITLISDVDEVINSTNDGPLSPRNVHSMLNDIKRKYGRIQEVREAIEKQDEPISRLLKLRNAAAHASVDGKPREVSAEDLKSMVELLNIALNELAKCGLAIQAYKKSTCASQ